MAETLLYVGLDNDDRQKNLDLVETLTSAALDGHFGFKVNLDHALIWGHDYIEWVVARKRPVFVDLKMNNGSRTMSHVVRWLGEIGVAHASIWAHADTNLAKTMQEVSTITDRPHVLGATFYTRWNEAYAQTHYQMSLKALISHWAYVAVDNGADGIILPGNHLDAVANLKTIKLTPGVRMPSQETQSQQEQVSGPYEAVLAGSDILVVGSPIYGDSNPVAALNAFLSEIKRAEMQLEIKQKSEV